MLELGTLDCDPHSSLVLGFAGMTRSVHVQTAVLAPANDLLQEETDLIKFQLL